MSVRMSFGGLPVPMGWRLWGPVAHQRPEPGSWFFEARYHHTGHWKVGLDFRPLDGAFPSFWMPPLMWKHAGEIEMMEALLKEPPVAWAPKLLNAYPSNIGAFEAYVVQYGEKAKKKKKLLFGSAETLGAHEHEIPAKVMKAGADGDLPPGWNEGYMLLHSSSGGVALYLDGMVLFQHGPQGSYTAQSYMVDEKTGDLTGGMYMAKSDFTLDNTLIKKDSLIPALPPAKLHELVAEDLIVQVSSPGLDISEFKAEEYIPGAGIKVGGKDWPYDPVLMKHSNISMPVVVRMDGAMQLNQGGWGITFVVEIGDHSLEVPWVDHNLGSSFPLVKVPGYEIMEMSQERIDLKILLSVDGEEHWLPATFDKGLFFTLFPHTWGHHNNQAYGEQGFFVSNQDLYPGS